MERTYDIAGLTFVIAGQGTEELPVYGKDVVAIVTNDDYMRAPLFAGRVGLIFKTLGLFPVLDRPFRWDRLQFLLLLALFRWYGLYLKSRLKLLRGGVWSLGPMRNIPIGDRDLVNLQPKPILERPYDASFIGSLKGRSQRKFSPAGLLGSPKEHARQLMVAELEKYRESRPQANFLIETRTDFDASRNQGPLHFSEVLAQTKICISPRGSCPETYRVFQGARFGCVLITEELPDLWYYRNHPAYVLSSWTELPKLLDTLLADPALLEAKSRESRAWWENTVCEKAVGRYVAQEISAVLNRAAPLLANVPEPAAAVS